MHEIGETLIGLNSVDIEKAVYDSLRFKNGIDLNHLKNYRNKLMDSNGVLELLHPENVDKAIGLESIISKINKCVNSKEGRGTLLLGVPGTGKSLIAKNLALNNTVIKFNIERIFGKYVGDSEKNITNALHKIERFAEGSKVVVFIDELEKVLNGVDSSGDSGVTTRVLKVLLEWMQDKGDNIYLLATANKLDKLLLDHPEYLRAERWDFIFGLGFLQERG